MNYKLENYFSGHDFPPYLSKEDVEDIIDNLEQQVEFPTIVDYINAIRFYKKHDAFIVM